MANEHEPMFSYEEVKGILCDLCKQGAPMGCRSIGIPPEPFAHIVNGERVPCQANDWRTRGLAAWDRKRLSNRGQVVHIGDFYTLTLPEYIEQEMKRIRQDEKDRGLEVTSLTVRHVWDPTPKPVQKALFLRILNWALFVIGIMIMAAIVGGLVYGMVGLIVYQVRMLFK